MPSYTVYEDTDTKAFLDIFGATDGHVLVIPKRHGKTILDFSPQELAAVWATAQKVAKAIESAYETTILTIGINHGEPAGVPHLHVHLMPRFEGDGGGIIQSLPGVRQTTKEFGVVAEKIKKHIA